MGAVVSFYPKPDEAVIGTMIQPNAVRVAGEVIGTFPAPPFGKGKIRDLGLVVRGRTNRKMRISINAHYVQKHLNYREADAANKDRG